MERFVVRHYAPDERPVIKGNGFDGLSIGEDREEAEEFIALVNWLMAIEDAARHVRDAFRRDLEQGYVTKDKTFVVGVLSEALNARL